MRVLLLLILVVYGKKTNQLWLDNVHKNMKTSDFILLKTCVHDVRCLRLLGDYYYLGRGVKESILTAVNLWNLAATGGDADAQFRLGLIYTYYPKVIPIAIERVQIDLQKFKVNIPKEYEKYDIKMNYFSKEGNKSVAMSYFYAAGEAGHPGALMTLGYFHHLGKGVPLSCSTALKYFLRVAAPVNQTNFEIIPQGSQLISLTLPDLERESSVLHLKSIEVQKHVAKRGNTKLQLAVGKRYLLGLDGFDLNYKEALKYIRMAAEQDESEAFGLLGYIYAMGLDAEKDMDVAYEYFLKAVEIDDNPLGHNGLGFIYFNGLANNKRDSYKAYTHFKKAATLELPDAMFNLGTMYLSPSGIKKNNTQGIKWLSEAMANGHVGAAYTLALMHMNGVYVNTDCDMAVRLLRSVAERHEWVTDALQQAYKDEMNGELDKAKFIFFQLGITGHDISQVNLAFLYEKTKQLHPNNLLIAQEFYKLAAEQKSVDAKIKLGDFAYYGYGIQEDEVNYTYETYKQDKIKYKNKSKYELRQTYDYNTAFSYYLNAVNSIQNVPHRHKQELAKAYYRLGFMYEFGLGVEQDFYMARIFYNTLKDTHRGEVPGKLMLYFLQLHEYFNQPNFFSTEMIITRFYIIGIHFTLLCILIFIRQKLA